MLNNTISDVFFDLDHTLWDFEKNSALALDAILKKYNIKVSLEDFLEQYIPVNFKYWELYREDKISQETLRYGRLKETFDKLGLDIDDETINVLSVEYIAYLPKFNHLFEGTIEILDYLKSKYKLHIITNGFHEVQRYKLKNSEIQHYFETITDSEKAGVKKPNPLIFQYALNAAKANPANSVMIGDCFEADVKGALNFGLDAIYFNEHHAEVTQEIKQINHLLDLKRYL
ncbi:YjjG family noncanonical pyrimidine nucleotidase [Flavobacterium sp. '19STA2R22 D10 B1']|uniref:YjjG family noncanonical pyrimidine nucleotidase n=1 Tax=Flavobacterium aerium TaxID=3037261 RepID=UPI00278C44E3|nr:YjjG family noncanonical pyrimidine nucleotidase [Flavobacterium sp. '19STA2R22 D10 B1']